MKFNCSIDIEIELKAENRSEAIWKFKDWIRENLSSWEISCAEIDEHNGEEKQPKSHA